MIKLKSLKEPVDEELDGFRVAITRSLYPYTLPKMQKAEKKKYDEWWLELAPTKELKDAYIKFKTIDWDEYVKRFTFEIKNNPKALKALEKLNNYNNNNSKIVTLLCHCEDENHCHRSLVKQMVIDKFWLKGIKKED